MAKYERPNLSLKDFSGTEQLFGMWSMIGYKVVYEMADGLLDKAACNKIFTTDPISYSVFYTIIKKNVNANEIRVHQVFSDVGFWRDNQYISDVQKTLAEVDNPQLIAAQNSNFIVIVSDASYGIDVWVWDLTRCKM